MVGDEVFLVFDFALIEEQPDAKRAKTRGVDITDAIRGIFLLFPPSRMVMTSACLGIDQRRLRGVNRWQYTCPKRKFGRKT